MLDSIATLIGQRGAGRRPRWRGVAFEDVERCLRAVLRDALLR
jgi:hypothetical protein